MSKQTQPVRGAAQLADTIHRALHRDGMPAERVSELVGGTRRALMERAHRIAQSRRATAVSKQARERWAATAAAIRYELDENPGAYTNAPLRVTRDHAHGRRRRTGGTDAAS